MSHMKGCWFNSYQRHDSYLPALVTPCGTGAADSSHVAFTLTQEWKTVMPRCNYLCLCGPDPDEYGFAVSVCCSLSCLFWVYALSVGWTQLFFTGCSEQILFYSSQKTLKEFLHVQKVQVTLKLASCWWYVLSALRFSTKCWERKEGLWDVMGHL